MSFAEKLPALPNPWTTTRAPSRSMPRCLAASMICRPPRAVARAAFAPPDGEGLPGHHGERRGSRGASSTCP